ncbi:TrgA family protein [Algicella marina]|uniref:TrgA family protein n=1 Tax=Algicella marina TaxID=2683284 RepID=A0A6P1SXP1_9RHOB|nr:TrgA family protein [Algicella marina]QHQ35454.1 TrgA family protein [Algicella marina]
MGIENALGMPTAARLVAAICVSFSLLIMVYVVTAYLPEERLERYETRLLWVFGIYGLYHGWYGLGKKATVETGSGVFLGLRSAITVTVAILFMCAISKVIDDILDSKLAGANPMEAIKNMFAAFGEYFFLLLAQPKLLIIFAITGIICGVLARNAAKRWD